jgi:hypothetical protein
METPKEADDGYAEEQPGEVAGDQGESERRDSSEEGRQGQGRGPGTDDDDGKATGNPRSAG